MLKHKKIPYAIQTIIEIALNLYTRMYLYTEVIWQHTKSYNTSDVTEGKGK